MLNKNEAKIAVLDDRACYAALRARDSRFDGRFFTGVSSTGIYCRPVCRVKLPKETNCSFFASAAAAEAAGFRPCLRCRPELAPGLSQMEAVARIARKAAALMEEEWLDERSLADLAERLGITDRHLRRAFAAEYGVSPAQYLQTRRLLLAKSLLTDTRLPITAVAMATGFGSIRRFNDLFKKRYRLTPSGFRKLEKHVVEKPDEITLALGYRPPYAWEALLGFLARRAVPGVESVAGGAYRRTVALSGGDKAHQGWISVAHRPERSILLLTVSPSLLPVLPKIPARVRALFDLNCSPEDIREKLAGMEYAPGTRLPGSLDVFETAVGALLGQLEPGRPGNLAEARAVLGRLAEAYGEPLKTPFADLRLLFPGPEKIAARRPAFEERAGELGLSPERAAAISALAEALCSGQIGLSADAEPKEAMDKLRGLPGFTDWAAQYVAMRALGWPDAFPDNDPDIQKALAGRRGAGGADFWEPARPWRSYAAMSVWNLLEND